MGRQDLGGGASAMPDLDLSLLGLEPGKIVWGQLGKAWWPGRVSRRALTLAASERARCHGSRPTRAPL